MSNKNSKSASNYSSALVTATTGGVELSAQNQNRTAFILFNQGPSAARVYFDGNSTMYYEIAIGEGMTFPEPPINQVNALTASGTAVVSVLEA